MRILYNFIKDTFGFSTSQTNAFIILLPLIAVVIFSEPVFRRWKKNQPEDFSKNAATLDSLIALWEKKEEKTDSLQTTTPSTEPTYFNFDPNQASSEELLALGFNKSLANRIINYRGKGGKFIKKTDLLKIYGMDSLLYNNLLPFIQLPEKLIATQNKEWQKKGEVAKKEILRFDLNQADTAQLKKVYGIGEKLSLRILKFREGLGGFTSITQLTEVYALDTAVITRLNKASFIAQDFQPKQININVADSRELAVHPYISKQASEAIVAYRFQHGNFKTLDELQNIKVLDAISIIKIKPYLKLND
jgi:competence protein ComEA